MASKHPEAVGWLRANMDAIQETIDAIQHRRMIDSLIGEIPASRGYRMVAIPVDPEIIEIPGGKETP